MNTAWELPSALVVGGLNFNIRTDFRAIIDIIKAYRDPDFEDDERTLILLMILYEDFDSMPCELYEEAIEAACDFIDMGIPKSEKSRPSVMDWEQDAPLIISAINGNMRTDIRSLPHLHWWTFLSAYMELGDTLYTNILNVRTKKALGKKLEKHELQFIRDNRHLVELKTPESTEVRAEKDSILKALGGGKMNGTA